MGQNLKLNSLFRLSQKNPAGEMTFLSKPKEFQGFWATEEDINYYKKNYDNVIINDDNTVIATERPKPWSINYGYLFNGEDWVLVQETWDGWIEVKNE